MRFAILLRCDNTTKTACAWPSCSTIQARKKLEIHFFVIKWLSDFCPMSPFVLKVQCRCTSQTLLVLNDWIIQVPFAKQWSLTFLNIEMCHVHNDFENDNFYILHTTFFYKLKVKYFIESHKIVFVSQKSVWGVESWWWLIPNAGFKKIVKQTIIITFFSSKYFYTAPKKKVNFLTTCFES